MGIEQIKGLGAGGGATGKNTPLGFFSILVYGEFEAVSFRVHDWW